ncbi:unnamed protein product, partial [Effrenium voratum]
MSCFNLDFLFKPALRLGLALRGIGDYLSYQPPVPDKKEHIGSSSEIPSVPMPVFAPPNTEADLRKLRQLIAEDVPFLIQWPEEHPLLPAEKYEAVEAYLAKTLAEDGYKEDEEFLIVKFEEWYAKYGELDKLVEGPHVDAMFGSVNVYYMARGSKSVKILTRAATERLPMRYKDDYLFPQALSLRMKYAGKVHPLIIETALYSWSYAERTENKEAEPAILDEKEWVDRAMTSPCSSNMDETLKVVEDGEEGPDQAAKDELKRLTFQKVYAHMGNEIPPEQLKNAIVVKTAKFHPITVIFLQVVTLGLFNFFRPKDDETLLVLTENGRVYLLKVERPNAFGVDIHAALMTFLRLVLLLALILTGPAFVVMVFGSSAVGDGDDFQLNNGNIVQQELDLDVKVYRKALHSTVLLVTVATTLLLIVGCWLYTNWPADYATRSRQSFKAETVSSIQYSISGSSVARSLKMRLYFGKYPGQAALDSMGLAIGCSAGPVPPSELCQSTAAAFGSGGSQSKTQKNQEAQSTNFSPTFVTTLTVLLFVVTSLDAAFTWCDR